MNVLFFAWKDIRHPLAGGAEVILHELASRLVKDGHQVTILTASYDDAPSEDTIDGISIIRVGSNRYLHSMQATHYYRKFLRHKFDIVIETVNTAPYFHFIAKSSAKSYLFYHQLAREIWFHETPAPLSYIGYGILEPLATFILGKTRAKTITISESTKKDLINFGFKSDNISIISEAIHLKPVEDLSNITKFNKPTILSLGSLRPMKRTLEQVKAFEIAKRSKPDLQMKISGDSKSRYGQQVLDYIAASPYKRDIEYLGRVTDQEKEQLMRKAHLIAVTSIKEGWGLIVTEAASQGTPAVVYDVDGLRDSVRDNETGIISATNPNSLAKGIVELLDNTERYERIRHAAWEWSKHITFDQSYKDFKAAIRVEGKK